MKDKEFLEWMLDSGYNQNKILGFIQSCHEIEQHEGSISGHYAQDGGRALLRRFRYSELDRSHGRTPGHTVPLQGDPVRQTDMLKKALKFYLDFLNCTEQQAVLRSGAQGFSARKIYAKRKLRPAAETSGDDSDNYYGQFRPRRAAQGDKNKK